VSQQDAAVLEDRDRLEHWLAAQGFTPYVDFEILTVMLEGGAVEIDPMGRLDVLLPALEAFAARHGFLVAPFDPETGTVSIVRHR
jgi:hypothetical protein